MLSHSCTNGLTTHTGGMFPKLNIPTQRFDGLALRCRQSNITSEMQRNNDAFKKQLEDMSLSVRQVAVALIAPSHSTPSHGRS